MKWTAIIDVAPLVGDRVTDFDGVRPYVATGDARDDGTFDSVPVTYADRPSRADVEVQGGDVALARMKSTSKVIAFEGDGGHPILSTGFAVFRPDARRLDQRYLKHWLRSDQLLSEKNRRCSGAIQPAITNRGISSLEIPLPPIEEQRRIASFLDAADALRTKRRHALEKLDILTQSIFIDMFGDGSDWSKLASSVSLGVLEDTGVVELGRGKVISKRDLENAPGDFPVYSSAGQNGGEFGRYGKFMFDEEMVTWSVDGGGHLFYRPRHKFSVTNVGGWLRVLDAGQVSARYLHAALRQLHSRLSFDWTQKAHTSVVRRVYEHVYIPPIDEQLDFACAAGAVDAIRQQMSAEEVAVENLFQSLQHRAFRGEL